MSSSKGRCSLSNFKNFAVSQATELFYVSWSKNQYCHLWHILKNGSWLEKLKKYGVWSFGVKNHTESRTSHFNGLDVEKSLEVKVVKNRLRLEHLTAYRTQTLLPSWEKQRTFWAIKVGVLRWKTPGRSLFQKWVASVAPDRSTQKGCDLLQLKWNKGDGRSTKIVTKIMKSFSSKVGNCFKTSKIKWMLKGAYHHSFNPKLRKLIVCQ